MTPSYLLRRVGFALVTFISAVSLALAQPSGTGTVQGRVLNVSNGSYLTNARVTVEGTQLQTFTNGYGEYRLGGVPSGPAKVHVFYTGQPEQVLTLDVPAGQTVTQDVNFGEAAAPQQGEIVKLDQYVVASQKDTDQKSIAINEQRFSPILKSVVSTDQFGDVTEGNVGEFLKYMPGISLEYTSPDARQIIIRGVNPIYTAVFVDGNRMASAASSGSNRFFELEQASINSASRIEVTFSRTPEQDADALGGAVNMISKSAFEVAHPKVDFRADVSFNGDNLKFGKTPGPFNSPERKWHPSFDLSYLNPVSKRFGFAINIAESDIYYPQHRSQPNWAPQTSGTGATAANPFLKSYQMQNGPKDNKRQNLSSKLDFKISDTDSFSITPQWNYYDAPFANRNLTWNVQGTSSTAVPTAWNGPTFVQSAPGAGSAAWGSSFRHKYGTTYQIDSHYIHRGPEWTFEGSASISHATNHYHDYQDGHFENAGLNLKKVTVRFDGMNLHDYTRPDTITVTDANGNPINSYANLGAYTINNGNFNEADSTDLFRSARLSAARGFTVLNVPTTVKIGATIQDHRRDIRKPNMSYSFVGPDGKAGTADDLASNYDIVDPSFSTVPTPWGLPPVTYPSPYKLYDLFLAHPEYWTTNAATNIANSAKNSQYIDEYITAAYLQADSRLLSNRLRAVYGIRFERTDDYAQGYRQDPNSGAYHDRGLRAKNHYAAGYPSIATTYNVTDNLIARASYTRALGRPDFGNIIPGTSLPDPLSSTPVITINNTTLAPEQADNYDLGLDYYFSHVGSLGVSVYRKDIENFFGSTSVIATPELLTALGIPDVDAYVQSGAQVKSKFNAGTARITGVQLDYKQQLTFIPLPQNQSLGVFASGYSTHLMGAPNADFSNYISKSLNTGLDYHTRWFSVKFNMNYRGQQRYGLLSITGLTGAYTYFKPRTQFDTTVDFPINRHFSAFINGRNIFNKAQDQEIYGLESLGYTRLSRREEFGAQWWVGIRGKF